MTSRRAGYASIAAREFGPRGTPADADDAAEEDVDGGVPAESAAAA